MDVALLALAVVAVAVGSLDDARRAAGTFAVAVAVPAGGGRLVDEVHGHEGRHHHEHDHGTHLVALERIDTARAMDACYFFSSHAEVNVKGRMEQLAVVLLLSHVGTWTADALVLPNFASKRLFIERTDFVVRRQHRHSAAGARWSCWCKYFGGTVD